MRWGALFLVVGADIYKVPDGIHRFVDAKPAAVFGGVRVLAAVPCSFSAEEAVR